MDGRQLRGRHSRLLWGSVTGKDSSTVFIAVIASLILIFYLLCMYHCMRLWICRKLCERQAGPTESIAERQEGEGDDQTVLVHEGRIFNLSEYQRRQVLEVIFSETSKPATDSDVAKVRKRRRRKDIDTNNGDSFESDEDNDNNYDVPLDVQIPRLETARTEDSSAYETSSPIMTCDRSSHHESEENSSFDERERESNDVKNTINEEEGEATEQDGETENEIKEEADKEEVKEKEEKEEKEEDDNSGLRHSLDNPAFSGGFSCSDKNDGNLSELSSVCSKDEAVRHPEILTPELRVNQKDPSDNINEQEQIPSNSNTSQTLDSLACEECSDSVHTEGEFMLRTTLPLPHELSFKKSRGFVIPENETVEECKEEIMSPNTSADEDDRLYLPIPLKRIESYASVTSEYTCDDGSTITGDNVCSICLSGYKMGDVLVTSKYCSHVFHKDCLLEWLDNNNNCPVCRVHMITANEINKAATTLVGKTRMVRAVASLHKVSYSRSPQSISPHRPLPGAISPFEGTVRRGAHSSGSS